MESNTTKAAGNMETLVIKDADNARRTSINLESPTWDPEVVRIEFGESYTLTLDKESANRFASIIQRLATR